MREHCHTNQFSEQFPDFCTDNPEVNQAWQLALEDLLSNVCMFRDGILKKKEPVMLAGSGYDTPWTRDASINTWNGAGLLLPDVAKNTLLSVLTEEDGVLRIGGQYWDAIIWTIGAWYFWLYSGDSEWYGLMKRCTLNSLAFFEATEWDEKMGLFRGPACYGDGIAAYPDRYVTGESGILSFPRYFPDKCVKKGGGIPIFTLSTNCLYAESYRLAYRMTQDETFLKKHRQLCARIDEVFWNSSSGTYDYAVDEWGRENRQEALGISFAVLFGIADKEKKESILKNCTITPNGMPCLYPCYNRYLPYGIGRHCGTVWPFAQAFFADAAAETQPGRFAFELEMLTRNALRSGQFAEIYHPETGNPYGGVQEGGGPVSDNWNSVKHQTWSATGYLRMILFDLAGMKFEENGICIRPVKVPFVNRLRIDGIRYRNTVINLDIRPEGWGKSFWIPAESDGMIHCILQ